MSGISNAGICEENNRTSGECCVVGSGVSDVFGKVETASNHELPGILKAGIIEHLHEELRDGIHALREVLEGGSLDLLEVCAPWDSPMCRAVRARGGRAFAIGIHNGFDLTKREGFLRAASLVRTCKPRYVHFSPPCDPWTSLQNCNQKTEAQRIRLKVLRGRHSKLIKNCRKLAEIQRFELNSDLGLDVDNQCLKHHFGGEHPLRAQSWSLPDMKRMVKICGERFVVYGCSHGLRNPKTGKFLLKPWGWFATHEGVRKALERACVHERGEHDHVQGSLTAPTAVYPYLLCQRFARALMEDDQRLFPVFDFERQSQLFGSVFVGENEPLDVELPDNEPDARAPDGIEQDADLNQEDALDDEARSAAPELDAVDMTEERAREAQKLLRTIHRNLGHPCQATLLRLLKDAGASEAMMHQAQKFECAECLQRGRRAPVRQAVPNVIREKWHTVSIDTFWWKFPKGVTEDGKNEYAVGLSIMDEATDYHSAVIIRTGLDGPQRSISSGEFKQAFEEHWLLKFPAPSMLRYDEEGFMRSLDIKHWLETFGMKLEPIAGESAWQLGKHSRHLQVLKEHMNLLSMELGSDVKAKEILTLAVSAKNSMHAVKGYSPNQWAFGAQHGRLHSFLQQFDNLPLQAARQEDSFEEDISRQKRAQQTFLEVDARRRIARALQSRCRPLKEFLTGQLVYYFRKGRREGARYGGTWYGPARVLCHERTSLSQEGGHAGSVVWISHAGVLIRCSPEQLRPVTRDLSSVDKEINGPRNFSALLEQVGKSQRYIDISQHEIENFIPDEETEYAGPRFRLIGKRAPEDLYEPPIPDFDEDSFEYQPDSDDDRFEAVDGDEAEEGGHGQSGRVGEDATRRVRSDHHERWPEARGQTAQGGLPGSRLQRMGSESFDGRDGPLPHEGLHDLPPTPSDLGTGSVPSRKRKPSHELRDRSEESQQRLHHPMSEGEDREARADRGPFEGYGPARRGRDVSVESSRRSARGDGRSEGQPARDAPALGPDGEHDGTDARPSQAESSQSEVRDRTVSQGVRPDSLPSAKRSSEHRSGPYFVGLGEDKKDFLGSNNLVSYVNCLDVLEIELLVAPRDVHSNRGVWVLNKKVTKGAEVNLRKLSQEELGEFSKAMDKEVDSYVSAEAVRICESHGVDPQRVMQMRWVCTWKSETDERGIPNGRKAKARLIIKGFQDPRLVELPREAPTLSSMGRNLVFSLAARNKTPLFLGDIKTAFLQGESSELREHVYGDPPPEVRERLQMRPEQILRIAKAIYGLLNAPKKWFESLSAFLKEDGWKPHKLDQCLFIREQGGHVHGYLGVHVDDVVCTGSGFVFEESVKRLHERFKFGCWDRAQEKTVVYCGCEVRQLDDFSVSVKQEKFSGTIDEIVLDQERKANPMAEITKEERTMMRQRLGALNWRATQTAPWLLATVSLLQGCVEHGVVSDLLSVNKLVRLQRKHGDKGLYFPSLSGELTIVTFTDASWATRRDGSSQGGQITLLMEKGVLEGKKTNFCVLNWSSRRLKRVARSSTSAEVQMTGNALDIHEFVKLGWYNMLNPKDIDLRKSDEYLKEIPSCLVCDAKNIFDGIAKVETSGLHMEERRTAIELLAVKERLQQAGVCLKWVNGDQELADGLTKGWKHEALIKALGEAHWRIVYDPEYQSARKVRAKMQIPSGVDCFWFDCLWNLAQ